MPSCVACVPIHNPKSGAAQTQHSLPHSSHAVTPCDACGAAHSCSAVHAQQTNETLLSSGQAKLGDLKLMCMRSRMLLQRGSMHGGRHEWHYGVYIVLLLIGPAMPSQDKLKKVKPWAQACNRHHCWQHREAASAECSSSGAQWTWSTCGCNSMQQSEVSKESRFAKKTLATWAPAS